MTFGRWILNRGSSQATIKEAMRLHPGVGFPLERHVPPEGAVLCGKYLPGGTNVSMTAPVVHHDRTIFGDDAESFRPERWLETDEVRLKQMDRCSLAVSSLASRALLGSPQ